MNTHFRLLMVGFIFASVTSSYATNSVFFCRIASTQPSRITSFNQDGTLTFSNAAGINAECRLEWSTSPTSLLWNADASLGWIQTTNYNHTIQISEESLLPDVFYLQGTVAYINLEGGFYGVTNSAGSFQPYHQWMIPNSAGAPVSCWAKLLYVDTDYQWGRVVELSDDPSSFLPFNPW